MDNLALGKNVTRKLYVVNKGKRKTVDMVYVVVAAATLLAAVMLVVPNLPEVNAVDVAVLIWSLIFPDEFKVQTLIVATAALGGCPELTKELI